MGGIDRFTWRTTSEGSGRDGSHRQVYVEDN